MKGDFTRFTFRPEKHYSGVRIQQGRVAIDADSNERDDIFSHRIETEAQDWIGPCGAPMENAGFAITPQGGDLQIGRGHYYVDGILCENEQDVLFTEQPDEPGAVLPREEGVYFVYLHVWRRHLTALEDRSIHEQALGGADTATRIQTVWQVRLLRAGSVGTAIDCERDSGAWNRIVAPSSGELSARARRRAEEEDPCIVRTDARFVGTENQLYRCEIHDPGSAARATFKWSRENGSIVVRWEAQDGDRLTVSSLGRDEVLNIAGGDWVELIDDRRELLGEPGILVRVRDAEGQILTIDANTATESVDFGDFQGNPRVRRWDMLEGPIDAAAGSGNNGYIPLESGVEVRFESGSYATGDYWTIPARTASADVEWPVDANGDPVPQRPQGIAHHYCRLGVLEVQGDDLKLLHDCRRLFPPATELTSLYYVGGDGQEATPDPTSLDAFVPLPEPLRAGVTSGSHPVEGARVRFTVEGGNGRLGDSGDSDTEVATGADGIASCAFELDSRTLTQTVKATLLSPGGDALHLPVFFTANLSRSAEVAYDPAACPDLAARGAITVQRALDELYLRETATGACAVRIEPGTDLQTALSELLERGQTRICFCLVAGDHLLENGLSAVGKDSGSDWHLRIFGCGPGTRLKLGRHVLLEGFESVGIQDLQILAGTLRNPIRLRNVADASISRVHASVISDQGALLGFSGASRIRIDANVLESLRRGTIERPVPVLRDLEGLDHVARVFSIEDRAEFTRTAAETVAEVARAPAGQRATLSNRVRRSVGNLEAELAPRERAAYRAFAAALEQGGDDPGATLDRAVALRSSVFGIREASSLETPGTALMIEPGDPEVRIEDNAITGVVSLYGLHTRETVSIADLDRLRKILGDIDLQGNSRALHMRNNRLTRLGVGREYVDFLRQAAAGERRVIPSLFEDIFVTENVIETGGNELVALNVNVGANRFGVLRENQLGWVVAHSTIYLGNQSANPEAILTDVSLPQRSRGGEEENLIRIGGR